MNTGHTVKIAAACVAACLWYAAVAGVDAQSPQSQEEFAKLQYESGLAFMKQQKYEHALKDFETVVNSYGTTAVAADALLQIAQYHLEIADNLDAARTATDTLIKKYPLSNAAAVAHIFSGRIVLAKGRAPADIEEAVGNFERVPRLFPGNDAVPISMYYAGEALRLGKRPEDALTRYRKVAVDYPRSAWAGRALLGLGQSLVQIEQPMRAIEDFQRVRLRFPTSPEAEIALSWNSILYRLYIRNPGLPVFTPSARAFTGMTGKLKDVDALAVVSDDRIIVTGKQAVGRFDRAAKFSTVMAAAAPRSLFLNRRAQVIAGLKGSFMSEADPRPIAVTVPKPDGTPRQIEDVVAGGALSTGEYLLTDTDAKTLIRVTPEGKYIGVFAQVQAARLSVNALDEVAVLPRDSNEILIFDRNGKRTGNIPARGTHYDIKDARDVCWDALGHLYVLDRGRSAVLVFSPQRKFVASYAPADKTPGAFREAVAFGVDAGGRLYLYDERLERVLIFQ